eukprot:evm.model.scf_1860.3 EVM.evm.TU.scf_1860.3   scf_1860:27737-28645(+)
MVVAWSKAKCLNCKKASLFTIFLCSARCASSTPLGRQTAVESTEVVALDGESPVDKAAAMASRMRGLEDPAPGWPAAQTSFRLPKQLWKVRQVLLFVLSIC